MTFTPKTVPREVLDFRDDSGLGRRGSSYEEIEIYGRADRLLLVEGGADTGRTVETGVQHDPTAQLTRIPAASTGDNQAQAGHRTNMTSGTGFGGRSWLIPSPLGRRSFKATSREKDAGPITKKAPAATPGPFHLISFWTFGFLAGQLIDLTQYRVEAVSQPVAQEVQRNHDQEDCRRRHEHQVGGNRQVVPPFIRHYAPCWRRWLNSSTHEAEHRFSEDQARGAQCPDHDRRVHDPGQKVLEHDAEIRSAVYAGCCDIVHLFQHHDLRADNPDERGP